MHVYTSLKGGKGDPIGASCFTMQCRARGFDGWRCGGVRAGLFVEVRTGTVALETAHKIASCALLLTMGLFFFLLLFVAERRIWHHIEQVSSNNRAMGHFHFTSTSFIHLYSLRLFLLLLGRRCSAIHHRAAANAGRVSRQRRGWAEME